MAGRITLINVVLTTLPLFYMSFFRAPTAVINRLTAIERQFLWGGNLEGKKIAWVAWSQVYASTERGGLGIQCLLKMTSLATNYALSHELVCL